ncbi:MAG: hypothetical protein FWF83_04635, partial [Clostridiales bacterium]|nr:hypothetical protein [Clostridiales bacterium]
DNQGLFTKGMAEDGRRTADLITVLFCALPILLAALIYVTQVFVLTIWQLVHFLPACCYFAYVIWSDSAQTDREAFESHIGYTAKIFGFAAFGLIAFDRVGGALTSAAPYLILYLLSGVCLMRILRDEGKLTAGNNITIMAALLLGSVGLALAQAPKLMGSVLGFLYQNVVSQLFLVVAMAVYVAIYGVYWVFSWMFSFLKAEEERIPMDVEGAAQEMLEEGAEALLHELPAWMQTAVTVLLVLTVAAVLYLVMRKLLGKRGESSQGKLYTETQESLKRQRQKRVGGLFRPGEPRLAVRWYYRKYLVEGAARGPGPVPSDTSLSIQQKYAPYFPREEAARLREAYTSARYRYRKEPVREDVDTAAELWRKLSQKRRG